MYYKLNILDKLLIPLLLLLPFFLFSQDMRDDSTGLYLTPEQVITNEDWSKFSELHQSNSTDPQTKIQEIEKLLEEGGFAVSDWQTVDLNLALPDPGEFVPTHVAATPMANGFLSAPPGNRRLVVEEVGREMEPFRVEAGVRVPFRTHLIAATAR